MFSPDQQLKISLKSLSSRQAGGIVKKTGDKFSELEFTKLEKIDRKAAEQLMFVFGTIYFPALEEIPLNLAEIFSARKKPGIILLRRKVKFENKKAEEVLLKAIHACKVVLFL